MIGACGSSGHSNSSATAAASSTTATVKTTGGTTISGSSTPTIASGSTTTATTPAKPTKPATGSTNVRVPATFLVRAGGKLDPPQIAVPALLAVQVTVVSRDGRAHHVVLKTPTPIALSVPANGRATSLVPGMKAGRYPLELDGVADGTLITGAEPGP